MRKEIFELGEFYHIYNRGVDKRTVFLNEREYLRFVHSLYLLNNFVCIPNRFNVIKLEPRELLTPIEPYVEFVAACLIPNHYHFMLTPKVKNGVSKFMHKVNSSHTHYFNLLHERSGRLFEGPYKAKHVDRQDYASYLTQYIHLNPVDLYRSKIGTEAVLKKVKEYPWSSLPIYLGKKNSISLLISTQFRDEVLDMNLKEYQQLFDDLYLDLYRS